LIMSTCNLTVYAKSSGNTINSAFEEIERLRALNESLVGRMAAAIEVLCRKANGQHAPCPHCGEPIDWNYIVPQGRGSEG
jgi:hypothetical protein